MTGGPTRAERAVPVRIFLPADPAAMHIGGIATFVRGFVKYADPDFAVSMVGMSASLEPWQWHTIEFEGKPVQFLPVGPLRGGTLGRLHVPLAARFVAALAARGRDLGRGVVSSFHRPMTDLPVRRLAPMWRVVHLALEDLTTPGSESRWAKLPAPLAASERHSFGRMDHIYVVNRRVAERYRRRFTNAAQRIEFLPNWVDPEIFTAPTDADRAAGRRRIEADLGIPADAPLLLYAGRLDGQKDPVLLARALAALLRRRPAAHLLVAGSGGMEETFRLELSRLGVSGSAHMLGTVPRDAVAALMHAADALLITSAFETGPTVGLEALASGLPVVTTDVGEVAGIVARSGAGAVSPSREPAQLAAQLDELLARPRPPMTEAACVAARPFNARSVLEPIYGMNRALAARLPVAG